LLLYIYIYIYLFIFKLPSSASLKRRFVCLCIYVCKFNCCLSFFIVTIKTTVEHIYIHVYFKNMGARYYPSQDLTVYIGWMQVPFSAIGNHPQFIMKAQPFTRRMMMYLLVVVVVTLSACNWKDTGTWIQRGPITMTWSGAWYALFLYNSFITYTHSILMSLSSHSHPTMICHVIYICIISYT
jgi:hypothetical protein